MKTKKEKQNKKSSVRVFYSSVVPRNKWTKKQKEVARRLGCEHTMVVHRICIDL